MRKNIITLMMTAGLAGPGLLLHAAPIDKTNTLPDAKAGQCYAKVMVPAQYEIKPEKVMVREAAEKIETIAARYEWVEENVTVSAAEIRLVPVPAEYQEVTEKIETSPARRLWVTDLKKGGLPVSPALLAAARSAGVKLGEAEPGMCFNEYLQPAKFSAEPKDVLVQEAAEKVETVAAQYETIEEKVLVREASKKKIEIPAVYETVTEKILVEPAMTVWKSGSGPIERIDNTTGEIMCLVEVPAKYKTVEKQIIKTPATVKEEVIPAEYKIVKVRKLIAPEKEKRTQIPAVYEQVNQRKLVSEAAFSWHAAHDAAPADGRRTGQQICLQDIPAEYKSVTKQVVKKPASFVKEEVPAVLKPVKVHKLIASAEEKRSTIPAEFKTLSKRVKVGEESLEWRQVLCQTNMTPDVVTRVQQALKTAGFNPGTIDGVAGGGTLRAVEQFQEEKNLPRGGLTLRTLEALGVSL
ncbi:MAG: peptidoglycan-binding protein [Thiogranum sp.]|nr:peptidoglycan-binding protein [Thiogranum sp.]